MPLDFARGRNRTGRDTRGTSCPAVRTVRCGRDTRTDTGRREIENDCLERNELYLGFGFLLSMWNDDGRFELLFQNTIAIAQAEHRGSMLEIRLRRREIQ